MTLLAKGAAVSRISAIPSIGKNTRGSNEVTAMGTASVAHQTAINMPIAAVCQAASVKVSGGPAINISIAAIGPSHSPIF